MSPGVWYILVLFVCKDTAFGILTKISNHDLQILVLVEVKDVETQSLEYVEDIVASRVCNRP
jgi:hypothetical protein